MRSKTIFARLFVVLLFAQITAAAAIPDVILDCDIGSDIDDMADLAILHALADRGEINLLAMGFCMNQPFGPGLIEAVNRYYGRPEIPIGAAKASPVATPDNYGSLIFTNYYNLIGPVSNAPDAISLYRKILVERPDQSVTFLFTGMMVNLELLWHSSPDAFSPLNGRALMEQKVKRIYVVAGYFPEGGGEYNLIWEPVSALVLNEIHSVPLTFAGTELGWLIPIGSRIANKPEIDPVRLAHLKFYKDTGEVWRPSWTGVAVLDIARPIDTMSQPIYNRVKGWTVIGPNGQNGWITNDNGSQEYLRFARPTTTPYQADLDNLLMEPPLHATTNAPFAPFVRMDGQIISTPPFVRSTPSEISLENRIAGGGTIHFTLDGTAPTKTSMLYTGPFKLLTNATLRVVAYSADELQSVEVGPLNLEILPQESLTRSKLSVTVEEMDRIAISFAGRPGATASILRSPDLMNWIPIHTELISSKPVTLTENREPNEPQFYRALQE